MMIKLLSNMTSRRSGALAWLVAALVGGGLTMQAQAQTQEATRAPAALATDGASQEDWNWHVQATNTTQRHGAFNSPYVGPNSLLPHESAKETVDATLFLGLRLWKGGEFYINPELDQGYGLTGTLGVAGFTSGDAYKVGHDSAYGRLHRAFLRQTIPLGTAASEVESGANQLAGSRPDERLTLTLGKISVVDLFDSNSYAHDPRADFLNWSIIDGGAFDYAADSWGFSSGATAEWVRGDWSLRAGFYAMSKVPNGETLDGKFGQRQWLIEAERRYSWMGRPGAVRLLGFATEARMAGYADVLDQAQATGQMPTDLAPLRRFQRKHGLAFNAEQEVAQGIGAFVRYSWNDGRTEAYDFTDINRSIAAGLQVKGGLWQQPEHTLGVALASNGLSSPARQFFAAGGVGILVGDGMLAHYANERILEAYYKVPLGRWLSVTGDYQHVRNPAYNADRGPVSVFALRLHAEY
ncbi:carbohydrate porin [Roseateles puraquae]|jgi:high affinity Mn2+ porin|uniref:Carbohydrate porin n=1 Tax=Roseateles puraquae TaxID=431059 RepID=A0A254N9R3_9BURK|nr:carbohydrate porin [Roseateles puraquae]MDG0853036.1 carbohydrate porin [Roseateles puraquae]OWR02158.1 carbohydrate porin [Roseateles puraquae]RTL33971.1 MAG: carbohydrate porin [Burkholderiales bacterium]